MGRKRFAPCPWYIPRLIEQFGAIYQVRFIEHLI